MVRNLVTFMALGVWKNAGLFLVVHWCLIKRIAVVTFTRVSQTSVLAVCRFGEHVRNPLAIHPNYESDFHSLNYRGLQHRENTQKHKQLL